MSNPTRVMVMRSGTYRPLPNHLSLPWHHSWGILLPFVSGSYKTIWPNESVAVIAGNLAFSPSLAVPLPSVLST